MADKPTPSEITRDLFDRLRLRERDGEIFLLEVGDGAGFGNRGWSDAISMQTWPSKDLVIRGYEVKATRSDWLRELDNPEKNRKWQQACDEWYVVAPKGVVVLEELPPAWGLLVPKGELQLRIASRPGAPSSYKGIISRGLLAAVFRAAANERKALETDARREIEENVEKRHRAQMERYQREARDWEKRHMELVEALGGHRWDDFGKLKKLAAAVRQIEANGDDPKKLLAELRTRFERTASRIENIENDLWETEEEH